MQLQDAVLYLCKKYPISTELSKARLTKLMYLADWESYKRTGASLTSIDWYFHNFGPYVDDVVEAARLSPHLEVIETSNFYGEKKEIIAAKTNAPLPELEKAQSEILDSVINQTKTLFWNDFIKYVYSTPPILGSDRYTVLNMEHFAKKYRQRG